jgi:hypothetical protein
MRGGGESGHPALISARLEDSFNVAISAFGFIPAAISMLEPRLNLENLSVAHRIGISSWLHLLSKKFVSV